MLPTRAPTAKKATTTTIVTTTRTIPTTTPTIETTNNPTIRPALWLLDLLPVILRNQDTETIIVSETTAAVVAIPPRIDADVDEVPARARTPTIVIEEAVGSETVNDTNRRKASTAIPNAAMTTIRMIATTGLGLEVIDIAVKALLTRMTAVVEAGPVAANVERSDTIITTIIVRPVRVEVLPNEKDPRERGTSGITVAKIKIATRIVIVRKKRRRILLLLLPEVLTLADRKVIQMHRRLTRRRLPTRKKVESEYSCRCCCA